MCERIGECKENFIYEKKDEKTAKNFVFNAARFNGWIKITFVFFFQTLWNNFFIFSAI